MLSQPTALLLAAPARHVIVRTELVHGSDEKFDWLDAGAGFGFAVVSAAIVLLVVGVVRGRRLRSRSAKGAS
jgi:hypothetical protein